MQIEHSEFQDQLVRGLAHRMNNILTLFHGYVGLLLDNKRLDRETVDGLNRIKEGAKAASELMDRTHSLVRPSAIVWREINFGEFLNLLRPGLESLRGPKTVLEFDCPENLPHVWADMSRVRTAVTELVRNACEATAEGGKVRVELRADGSNPGSTHATPPLHWLSLRSPMMAPASPPHCASGSLLRSSHRKKSRTMPASV
jgi:signal transduction histidine kinase